MQKLIQTEGVTTEFYPKIHALNDGTFRLVHSGGITVQKFLLESTTPVPEEETKFISYGYFGTYYIELVLGGGNGGEEHDITGWVTTLGSEYDGSGWVYLPLEVPEPDYTGYSDWDLPYVYTLYSDEFVNNDILGQFAPIEYEEDWYDFSGEETGNDVGVAGVTGFPSSSDGEYVYATVIGAGGDDGGGGIAT